MQKKNCFTSLICAAVFLFFLFQCELLSPEAAYWPRLICIVGLFLAGLEIVLEGYKWKKTAETQERLFPLTKEETKRGCILLAILILWAVGLTTIGFLVSSIIILCTIAIVFEPQKTKKYIVRDAAACVVFGIMFYFTFKLLGVHFPRTLLM